VIAAQFGAGRRGFRRSEMLRTLLLWTLFLDTTLAAMKAMDDEIGD
jgi:hypothetical protein